MTPEERKARAVALVARVTEREISSVESDLKEWEAGFCGPGGMAVIQAMLLDEALEKLQDCMVSISQLAQRSEDEDCNEFTNSVNAAYKAASDLITRARARQEGL